MHAARSEVARMAATDMACLIAVERRFIAEGRTDLAGNFGTSIILTFSPEGRRDLGYIPIIHLSSLPSLLDGRRKLEAMIDSVNHDGYSYQRAF